MFHPLVCPAFLSWTPAISELLSSLPPRKIEDVDAFQNIIMLGLFEGSNSAGEYANACHAKGIKHACLRGTEERAANGGQVFTQRERQRETGGERASSYSRGIVNI